MSGASIRLEGVSADLRQPLRFARYPAAWYLFCAATELRSDRPVARTYAGRELICFRGRSGAAVVMNAHCCHMGANLGGGCVIDGEVECPFHGWRFGESGHCQKIPAGEAIPQWAKQKTYPVAERYGHIFFFLGEEPDFEFPSYEGVAESELLPAPVFQFKPQCPWYMVAANGFDLQHFRLVHDRVLYGEPTIEQINPYARRITMQLGVEIENVKDRLVAHCFGTEMKFTVTCWGGTLLLVSAQFERTTTYGLVSLIPQGERSTLYRNIIMVRRSGETLLHRVFDAIDARVRRWFVREFVRADESLLKGTWLAIPRLIEADSEMRDYFYWVSSLKDNNRKPGEMQ